MKVLVTGGAGLVGMALRGGLNLAGHIVFATDMTNFGRKDGSLVRLGLDDTAAIEALVVDNGIEAIVHSGGISGPLMERETPLKVLSVNVDSTAFLLDLARRHALKRVLLMSSHVVYGETGSEPIIEDRALHPGTTYAASKVAGEALVESFGSEFGLSAASLRLTRVYGPYRRANCFLRQAIADAAAGRTTIIPCDRAFPYHFLYVEDVVGAVLACLEAPALHHAAYSVASGEVLTIGQVRDILVDTLPGARIDLVDGRDPAPELQTAFRLDRIVADTGWLPRYSLERGLAEYCDRFNADAGVLD